MGRKPLYDVPRSEQLSLFITKTIKENLYKVSTVRRNSINQTINLALEKYLDEHHTDIERYNAFFGEE